MADLPQQDTIKQYVADGATAGFLTTFYVPLETDGQPNIDVYVTPAGDTPVPESDLQVWGVDYTYTPNIDPITGGTITFLGDSIPAVGDIVTLNRDVQASLDVEFSNAQTFNGENLDDALDKLLLIEQQNKTYALQRNLSYVVNSYLPDATRDSNVQVPLLEDGQIWIGSGGGVAAATLEEGADTSVLRSELENDAPVTNGAHIVGYYDLINLAPTTVKLFLDKIAPNVNKAIYCVDTGTVNALVVTPVPALTTIPDGTLLRVKVLNTSTVNSPTINPNGLGAGFIFLNNGLSLLPGDLYAGMIAEIMVKGGVYTLLNPYTAQRRLSVAANAYCSSAQSWNTTAAVKVLFDTADYDPMTLFDAANNRFIANYAGKYKIGAMLAMNIVGGTGGNSGGIMVLKNGGFIKRLSWQGTVSQINVYNGSIEVEAAANDYFEIWALKTDAANASYATDGIGGTPKQCSEFTFDYLGTS